MHKISVDMHKNQNQNNNGGNVTDNGNSDKFAVEERRRQVASMLSQSVTERVASQLGVASCEANY